MVLGIKPSKVVAVGLNYKDHAKEVGMPLPQQPLLFMKPASSIIASGEKIILPEESKRVDFEAELAIVIGKKCKNVSVEKADKFIAGYTCLNDVTARDLQKIDGQWTRSKSFDTFCPIGPEIVQLENPNNVRIQAILNGELEQDSNTSNFIFNVYQLVSYISKIMTLEKDDIITTGTPAGIGPMKSGDVIEIKIDGIGTLKNFVE